MKSCTRCAAAEARATEALALLTHWQGRAADLEAALAELERISTRYLDRSLTLWPSALLPQVRLLLGKEEEVQP
jgi:hypothetical protein